MGICVSTRDFNEVGYTISIGRASAEVAVDGGDELSLLKVDGVALDSVGSKLRALLENWRFGEKVALPGESPFIVMPLKVSSRPEEGEFLVQGVWPDAGSMVFIGDVSRDVPR